MANTGNGKKGASSKSKAVKKAPTKKLTKKSDVKQEQIREKSERYEGIRGELFAAILVIAGVLTALSLATDLMGFLGKWIKIIFTGLLSYAAFVIPIAMIYLGIQIARGSMRSAVKAKLISIIIFTVSFSSILQVVTGTDIAFSPSGLFNGGQAFTTGGAIGGFIALPMSGLCGDIGCYIIFGCIALVTFCIAAGISFETIRNLWGDLRYGIDEMDKNRAEKREKRMELEQVRAEKREQEQIEAARKRIKEKQLVAEKRTELEAQSEQEKKKERKRLFDDVPTEAREKRKFNPDVPLDGYEVPIEEQAGETAFENPETLTVSFNGDGEKYGDGQAEELPEIGTFDLAKILKQKAEVQRQLELESEAEAAIPAEKVEKAESVSRLSHDVPLDKEPPKKMTKEDISEGAEEFLAEIETTQEASAAQQQKLYTFPPVTLLKKDTSAGGVDVSDELRMNSVRLVEALKSFGVEAKVLNVSRGPAITRYEVQPSAGVRLNKITALADDLALSLAAESVRIEGHIPGKSAIGIEIPNKSVNTVYIRDIIESDEFKDAKSKLTFALGLALDGGFAVGDIYRMPHMLIAGATGSGKSVCINSIIVSLLYKASPDEVKLLLIDPKMVELGVYNGIPHLIVPVVTDPRKAAGALNWAVNEMVRRYKLFADNNVRDLKGFNAVAAEHGLEPMPQMVIVIDELADLMMVAAKEVEDYICRLAQMARAAGMHLIIATQRPSVDVVTGLIKANVPSRIAFATSSQIDSRTILDTGGAEKLLGRGDMLFYPLGASKPKRVQGCFVSDGEVESIVEFLKDESAQYNSDVMAHIDKAAAQEQQKKSGGKDSEEGGNGDDEMLPKAIECVVEAGLASTSLLQRKLKLGYARAARIVDEMEARGIVGPYEGSKPRQVLITRQQWQEMVMRTSEASDVSDNDEQNEGNE